MQSHKIIHVIYAGLGGHANVVFPLLETTFGQNHEHIIVFFGVEQTLPDYISQSEALGIKYYSIQKKPRRYLNAFKQFKTILKNERADRIIVHSSELIIPAKKYAQQNKHVKAFYVEHENNQSKGRSLRILTKYALKKADAVVCLNENYKSELEDLFSSKVPIYIIPNGVDTEKYKPNTSLKKSPIIIGMGSRMIPGRDHPNLLIAYKKVIEKYPNTELHIAGSGETLEQVKQLATSLELDEHVKFLGLLNAGEMVEFYAKLDCYVLATNAETLSTAILQAMSCGLPVLTADIPNNKSLIQPKQTGWLYEDKNSVDLATQMQHILADLTKARKIGAQARAAVIEKYSVVSNAKKYEELIR